MASDSFPSGFGAKIQPSHHTDQALYAHNPDDVPFVVCKLNRASWFINQPRDAFLSPDQSLFLSTYEQDRHLVGRSVEDEVDIYRELQGDAQGAFAGDRFTYEGLSNRELIKEIEECVQRQLAIHYLCEEEHIDMPLFPLIPGFEDWHFEWCHPLLEVLGTAVGFDATQYNSPYVLGDDLTTMRDVLGADRIFVNGCVSPTWLRELPREVVAFSGKKTIEEEAHDANGYPDRALLRESIEKRLPEINTWQANITEFQ